MKNSETSNSKMIIEILPTMAEKICYECNTFKPMDELQDQACTVCYGMKCRRLHGGHIMHNCATCQRTNLCSDCVAFQRCCLLDNHPQISNLRTWHLQNETIQ